MKKAGKKLIALLVIFTSIISFLPVEFGGQLANAAVTAPTSSVTDASAIHVYNGGGNTPSEISLTTNSTNGDQYYEDKDFNGNVSGVFYIGVTNLSTTPSAVQTQAQQLADSGKSGTLSVVTDQKVEITSINGITWTSDTDRDTKLGELGITIEQSAYSSIIGAKITGMPLGVTRVTYNVIVTTTTYNYTGAVKNGTTITPGQIGTPVISDSSFSGQNMKIYFGANYLNSTIDAMTFKAYTGDSSAFDDNDNISNPTQLKNNTAPFLYVTDKAKADSNMPLKYTFDVPYSLSKLLYIISLNGSGYSDAIIYKNNQKQDDTTISTGTSSSTGAVITKLTGALTTQGSEDFILIRITASNNIQRTLSVDIDYNYPDSSTDYTMYQAGITKSEYAADDNVEAYIGKVFSVSQSKTSDYNVYTGDIYIDSKAGNISIDPTLSADKEKSADQRTLAYQVTNHYYDPTTKSNKVAKSVLKDGKQYVYIDYDAGATNAIYIDVYAGENGTPTSSTILAEYILNVTVNASQSQFNMGLAFDGNSSADSTYLTQPGVTKADNGEVSFSTSRRTYDLYTTDPNKVKVTLSGQTSNNEYLKIWLAKGTQSNALYDAPVSQSGDDYDVTLDSGAKKMVVQAYYDSTTGAAASYAVGDTYVFYLPEHYDSSDTSPGDGGSSSADASLSDLEVKGITLKDSDGNSGFSSTEYDYTATVDKGATTAKITATATDSNVKSIVATVKETNESDDLTSGEESEIALGTNGKTTVNIVVTAQDGITTRTYTLIIQNNTKNSNADLENVILNTGDYNFDPSESTTTVRVSQDTTSITVTPVPADSNATVTVNGDEAADGPITVDLRGSQKTEIEIVVTSQDGTETKTYTLEVYRTDSTSWQGSGDDSSYDDQYYDEYYNCWVDTTKYDEWGTVDGKPVYFDKNHRQVKDAWITTGGKYYYLNSSGYRSSGWKVDSATGQSYYLDPTTGEMKLGWINLNNTWYYLGLNGVMHKGWLYLNGKWYYFTPNGQMVVNQTMFVDDKNYTFGQDGTVTA